MIELQEVSAVFELPQSVLAIYPQLAELSKIETQHLVLAVYYYNRSIQEVLNTLSKGRLIRGLTVTWIEFVLNQLRSHLTKLRSTRDPLLHSFLLNEEALLAANCRGLSEQGMFEV